MVVQHNMQAANANRMLGITVNSQQKSTEKLSSGYRINRAADDAAGLAISEKMRSQIRGLDRASTNAQDGISVVQTAEGALNEVHSMLQRMNELATQAANDTNTTQDRKQIQLEVDQLTSEIDRVSSTTQFNTMNLLDGSFSKKNLQVGSLSGQTIELNIGEMSAKGLGLTGGSAASAKAQTLTADQIADQFGTSGLSGITDTLADDIVYRYFDHTPTTDDLDADKTGKIDGDNDKGLTTDAGAGWYAVDSNNKITDGKPLALSADEQKLKGFKNAQNGDEITVDETNKNVTAASNHSIPETHPNELSSDEREAIYGLKLFNGKDGSALGAGTYKYFDEESLKTVAVKTEGDAKPTKAGWYKWDSTGNKLAEAATGSAAPAYEIKKGDTTDAIIGKNGDTVTVKADGAVDSATTIVTGSSGSTVGGLDVTTHDGAESAMSSVQNAIDKVSTQRATLGAVQNRLEHTIANLDNVSENTQSAESRIRDTDMAKEMVTWSKNNILAQAGQSMLAQANQSNQGVLSLLQ
jgi:flagellin